MLQLYAGLTVLVAVIACLAGAQQVDYYFLIPPDANNINKPYLQFVAGDTIEAQWHNPGDPITLYLTYCDGSSNVTILDSVENTGQASVTFDPSWVSDCGDYMLTVIGVQDGEVDWGQPTGSLPFNIIDVDNTPGYATSLTTLEVTDTDPVGFEAATAFIVEAVTVGSTAAHTTAANPPTTTGGGDGSSGGGGGSSGGGNDGNGGNGASGTTPSNNNGAASATASETGGAASATASNTDGSGGASSTSSDGNSETSGSASSNPSSGGSDSQDTSATGTASSNSDSGLSQEAKIGIGLGVGLGIPLLAIIGAIGWLLGRRNRPAPSPYGIEGVPTS